MPATATVPLSTLVPTPIPTPETKKAASPWGFVGGVGIALVLGAGMGFVFGRRRFLA
jgi:hypothetical protein